jgi:hypothetical protein
MLRLPSGKRRGADAGGAPCRPPRDRDDRGNASFPRGTASSDGDGPHRQGPTSTTTPVTTSRSTRRGLRFGGVPAYRFMSWPGLKAVGAAARRAASGTRCRATAISRNILTGYLEGLRATGACSRDRLCVGRSAASSRRRHLGSLTKTILPTAEPMVRRLAAGGRWIRTIGPPLR